MVRTNKSANQTQPTVSSTQEVVEVLNVTEKKGKKSSKVAKGNKKESLNNESEVQEAKSTVPEPVVQPLATVVSTPVVYQSTNEVVSDVNEPSAVLLNECSSLSTKMTELSAKIQLLVSSVSTVKSDYKLLEKLVSRELKNAVKNSRKKKSLKNRQPSGFVKPTLISDELAKFLGKTIGTEMARTDVSKEINQYIRLNSLQDKSNGRKIIPDNKLATLLKITGDDELTYFNLQQYMKHHFIKLDNAVAVSVNASV